MKSLDQVLWHAGGPHQKFDVVKNNCSIFIRNLCRAVGPTVVFQESGLLQIVKKNRNLIQKMLDAKYQPVMEIVHELPAEAREICGKCGLILRF